jgi:pyruvate, water dikinase
MKKFLCIIWFLTTLVLVLPRCGHSQNCVQKNAKEAFLEKIGCAADFDFLKGEPLSDHYAQVDAVKMVYDLKKQKLYFINHKKSQFHFTFCTDYLDYPQSLTRFNTNEYGHSGERRFLLANINHYLASDFYTIELFADDRISADQLVLLFNRVLENVYFKEKVFLLSNANIADKLAGIDPKKVLSVDNIFGAQRYQPMVQRRSFGYLRKVTKADFSRYAFSTKDIILTDFLPNDLPFCQGIITTEFQTPLSHINILSHNRQTPNCAHKMAWTNEHLQALDGKLVYYEVKQDSFYVREAKIEEAKAFWKKTSSRAKHKLPCNTKETALLDMRDVHRKMVGKVGGKAANFGELDKIRLPTNEKIPLPEAAFAIPFYYYQQHIVQHRLQPQIDAILQSDSLLYHRALLEKSLKNLQDSIVAKPLDPVFLAKLIQKLQSFAPYTEFRFRSSTNAEDVEGFTGAGLYTSKTGSLTNPDKSVERAVKKVWASLWTLRAFEERENANIDQRSLAMGILVHRAFGTEEANGVAITKNLYRDAYPAFTINVQKGEVSVVQPENGEIPEQFLIKQTFNITGKDDIAVDYISHSALNGYQPLLTQAEIKQLAAYLEAIKRHFYYASGGMVLAEEYFNFGMDVEFKLDKGTRKIYIKQARVFD